jgi:hypothetical protein
MNGIRVLASAGRDSGRFRGSRDSESALADSESAGKICVEVEA